MTRQRLTLTLLLAAPAAATANPAPATTSTIEATAQLEDAAGTVVKTVRLVTIERECVRARMFDSTSRFDVQLCHARDTAAGKVLHVTWLLEEGSRKVEHDAWSVVAPGGKLEVGAGKGKGERLVVSLKK